MSPPDIPAPFASVDEAVGALLDGELDSAAAEAGVPVAQLEEEIRSLPEFGATAAALGAARQALAVAEPLSQIARFRLLTRTIAAVTPGRGERKGRRAMLIGAAAAAVVAVLLGSAAFMSWLGGSNGGRASSTSGAAGDAAQRNLGDITNPETLRGKLQGEGAVPEAAPAAGPATQATTAADRSLFDRCRTSLTGQGFENPSPLGTATYNASPALVYDTTANGRRVVLVVDANTCTLLVAQSF